MPLYSKYKLILSNSFKKDLKLAVKRKRDISKLDEVVEMLLTGDPLPEKYRDHNLTGNWAGHRECHIEPDWLLLYFVENDVLTLTLTRTDTHSDLF
ncbi:MAG: type II toxin-antitoxin system YafQ family toxin [Thermoguttaceae bacterium]